jgi:diadenosine tetraphosphate (Ap4A) HIT family hydrolase
MWMAVARYNSEGKMSEIYRDADLFVEIHESPLPWLKVFTVHPYRELSHTPPELRAKLFQVLDLIEREMLAVFSPTKINIASFGNMLPNLHFHIIARFAEDSHFPEPLWGQRQRDPGYAPEPQALSAFYRQMGKRLAVGLDL